RRSAASATSSAPAASTAASPCSAYARASAGYPHDARASAPGRHVVARWSSRRTLAASLHSVGAITPERRPAAHPRRAHPGARPRPPATAPARPAAPTPAAPAPAPAQQPPPTQPIITAPEDKKISTGAIVAGALGLAGLVGIVAIAATGKKTGRGGGSHSSK